MQKLSAGKFHFKPPFTSFDHLVGEGERIGLRTREASVVLAPPHYAVRRNGEPI
jgi:hypothetical protein